MSPRIAILVLVAACVHGPATGVTSARVTSAPAKAPAAVATLYSPMVMEAACAVPAAIPDDGIDDRAAIQHAVDLVDTLHCAYLPGGQYELDTPQVAAPARRPSSMLLVSGGSIFGDGAATVLHFRGSSGGGDWQGLRMTGAAPSVHDIAIDSSAITDTNEQNHAIQVLGPSTDPSVYHVTFNHPIHVGHSGDCIQFVGYDDGRLITGARVMWNRFDHCDRSAVGVHSGAQNLKILDNVMADVGNTDLDFEGSGATSDVEIARNRMSLSPGAHGVGSLQLQLVSGARVHDNVFAGRGIDVYQSDDIEISYNTIDLTQTTPTAVIAVDKDSSRVNLHHNTLTRETSAGAGAVVSATPHGTGTPDHLTVADSTLVQHAGYHVISTSGVVGLYVQRNVITYDGPTVGMFALQALGSAGTYGVRTTDIHVVGNTLSGPLRGAVGTAGSYLGVGTVDTSDNVATGVTYGIYCASTTTQGGVTGPVTSTHDSWPAPVCGLAGFVAVTP